MQGLAKVRDRIGTSYHDVGICLLNDDTGQLMKAIIHDNRELQHILDEIFRRWITGRGKKYSRKVFIECLIIAKLIVLAEDLESACDRENKHTDRQTETFSSLPSSTQTFQAKEKNQVNEQLSDMESSTFAILSAITTLIVVILSLLFGCYCFKRDSIPGTYFTCMDISLQYLNFPFGLLLIIIELP